MAACQPKLATIMKAIVAAALLGLQKRRRRGIAAAAEALHDRGQLRLKVDRNYPRS
jgi:hypothetical protein